MFVAKRKSSDAESTCKFLLNIAIVEKLAQTSNVPIFWFGLLYLQQMSETIRNDRMNGVPSPSTRKRRVET